MNPRDVNRINYNNYYVGQNLDFLVRSKMRSESLSTPLKNTPPFYDDEVSSKMSLLGKRGYYDPGYIYGFSNPNQEKENNQYEQANFKRNNDEFSNPIFTKEQYEQIVLPKEHYKEQMIKGGVPNNELQNRIYKDTLNNRNNINYNLNNNYTNNNKNINDEIINRQKIDMLKERQTPQKLDDFQINKIEPNNNNTKNIMEKENNMNDMSDKTYNFDKNKNEDNANEMRLNEEREYIEYIRRNNNGMIRNQDKIPNQDYYKQISEYNYINELSKKNLGNGNIVLPLTRNQILQGVLTENNKKQFYNK